MPITLEQFCESINDGTCPQLDEIKKFLRPSDPLQLPKYLSFQLADQQFALCRVKAWENKDAPYSEVYVYEVKEKKMDLGQAVMHMLLKLIRCYFIKGICMLI